MDGDVLGQGLPGLPGEKGDVGAAGPRGEKGEKGLYGYPGTKKKQNACTFEINIKIICNLNYVNAICAKIKRIFAIHFN